MVTTRTSKRGKTPTKKSVSKPRKGASSVQGGLYPSIAISDLYNGVAHLYAASLVGSGRASLGFYIVACASLVGTLRFGFSESLFAKMNGSLAEYAAYVGLPLIGLSTWRAGDYGAELPSDGAVIVGLSLCHIMAQSLPGTMKEVMPVVVNVFFFVALLGMDAMRKENHYQLLSIATFLVGTVVIGDARDSFLLNVRNENWFHYFLGTSAIMMAMCLSGEWTGRLF